MANLASLLNADGKTVSHSDKRLANRFLKYWDSLRGCQNLPLITDLNFNQIGGFIPYAFNLDISVGSNDPKLCFVGRQLIEDSGGNVMNQRVSQLQPQSLLAKAIRHHGEVVSEGKPCMIADEFINAEGNKVLYRAVMMPFSNTGKTIDFIIGAINSKTVELSRGTAPTPQVPEDAAAVFKNRLAKAGEAPRAQVAPGAAPRNRTEVSELIAQVEAAMAATSIPTVEESSVMNNSDKVVLVVEDNAVNMRLCTELLNMHGYIVLEATDGMKGLQLAHEHRPNLILMDMQLPEISGLEVTKQLKEDETLRSIPVIAVTASALDGDEEKYLGGGCDGYIAKPISIANLLHTVEQFLGQPPGP